MRALILAVVCAAFGFYFWTLATSVTALPRVQGRETDYFNLLAHGFLKGQLSLDYAVPDALLQAKNPYDPKNRPPGSTLWDASLYQGKYYIYFGAAPVVAVFIPFILATGRDLPLPYAILLFTGVGYLALIGLFLHLRRKYFPGAGLPETLICLLALSFAAPLSHLFRRHTFYELPIAAGFCFFMLSVCCLVRSFEAARARRWLAGAGIFLGLAVGSRPTYAFCACIFLIPILIRPKDAPLRFGWREFLSATVPLGILVSFILAYNCARFGNPLEFGSNYQLSGIVESRARHFSLTYVPVNFWIYFLAPLRWGRYFPFVHGISPPRLPKDYNEVEAAFGSITNLPFLLFSLVCFSATILGRIRLGAWSARDRAVGILAASASAVIGLLCCFYGAVGRYMVDFTPALTLLSATGFLIVTECCRSWMSKSLALVTGLAAMGVSVFTSTLLNFESYGQFQFFRPGCYAAIAKAMDTPLFWVGGRGSADVGPLEITLNPPFENPAEREVLVETGWPDQTDRVFMEQPDPAHVRFGYKHGNSGLTFFSQPVAFAADKSQSLQVDMGSLYPPETNPFFRGMRKAEVTHLKNWVRVRLNGTLVWEEPARFFAAAPESVRVGSRARDVGGAPGFAGAIPERNRGRIEKGADEPWPGGGARVTVTLTPDLIGRSLPLATTGRTDVGDALYIQVLPGGKAKFAYDHWAGHVHESPVIPISMGVEHRIDFRIPSIMRAGSKEPLSIRIDDKLVFVDRVDFYPCSPDQVFMTRNVIGSSTCEAAFYGAKAEALRDEDPPKP